MDWVSGFDDGAIEPIGEAFIMEWLRVYTTITQPVVGQAGISREW